MNGRAASLPALGAARSRSGLEGAAGWTPIVAGRGAPQSVLLLYGVEKHAGTFQRTKKQKQAARKLRDHGTDVSLVC